MNRTLKSFYDSYHLPEIQKFLDLGKKKSKEVNNIYITLIPNLVFNPK